MPMNPAVDKGEALEPPPQTKARRKTPIIAGALLVLAAAVVVVSSWMQMRKDPASGADDAPRTTRSAQPSQSAMALQLMQQKQQAEVEKAMSSAREALQKVDKTAEPAAAPTGYVPPTNSVPRVAFAGKPGKCEDGRSLQERLKCLEEQWLYESRKVQLRDLGDGLTDESRMHLLGGDQAAPGSEGTGRKAEGRQGGRGQDSTFLLGDSRPQQWGLGYPGVPQAPGVQNRDPRMQFERDGGGMGEPRKGAGPLQKARSRFWLRAGSLVPCAFVSGATSALPGQVEAQVTRNVYDSIDHRHLLIPAGSMLVGRPNAEITEGQERIQFAWHELHLPDGEFRSLGGMTGADGAGYAGVSARVDRHLARKIGAGLFASTLNVSFNLVAPNPAAGQAQGAIAQGVGQGVVQTAATALEKMQRIADVLEIRPGTTCSVKVLSSMTFPRAYADGKRWRR